MPRSKSIKPKPSPATDFYAYTMQGVDIPVVPGNDHGSMMLTLQHQIFKRLFTLPVKHDSPFLRTVHAPMREVPKDGPNYVTEFARQIQSIQHHYQIADILQELHRRGSKALFNVNYDPDLEMPERTILYFHVEESLFSEDHMTAKHRKRCANYVRQLYAAFGLPELPAKWKFTLDHVERTIIKNMPSKHNLQSPKRCFNPLTEEQLNRTLTWMKWYTLPHKFPKVSVDSISYFEGIGEAIQGLPLEQWREYLTFHWIHHAAKFFTNTFTLHSMIVLEDDKVEDVEEHRVSTAADCWWQDASQQFIESDRERLTECRKLATSIAEDMRTTLKAIFENANWQKSTKTEALAKLENMELIVGWPQNIPIITRHHPDISGLEYFDEFIVAGRRYQYEYVWENNHTPTDRRRWRWESATTVNAFYSRESNAAYIPPSLFHEPLLFLDKDRMVENFAALGAIIAHELYHAFDNDSRDVDAAGELREWWALPDKLHYDHSATQVVQLYSRARRLTGNKRMNGRLTLSENIADLVALRLTWQALSLRLSYTYDRDITREEAMLFFHVYAVCQAHSYENPDVGDPTANTDLHSTAEMRVNLPLSTFRPFLDLYDIKPGDAMYTRESERPDFLPLMM